MLEIKKSVVSLDERDLMELERIESRNLSSRNGFI